MIPSNQIVFEKSSKGPVVYIRHAMSEYNQRVLDIPESQAEYEICTWDAPLTEKGKRQSEELSEKLKGISIKYAFCSPMKRCIQTALIALKDHPQQNIKLNIHPFITETVHVFHDFSKNINEKKELFGKNLNLDNSLHFDWSIFEEMYPDSTEQELYWLNFVDNHENDSYAGELVEKIKKNPLNEQIMTDFNTHFLNSNKRPESVYNMFKRNLRFKEYISNFIKNNNLTFNENEKILVFTHSDFTRISTSAMAYNMDRHDDFPVDCYKPLNCEMITMNIN
jgi:broad specificity phosphatase PhoE